MTIEALFESRPELQEKYMDMVRSHRHSLELIHPPQEVEKAMASYRGLKEFQKNIQQRRNIDLPKIDTEALRQAMENRTVGYAIPNTDFPAHIFKRRNIPEPPSQDLKVTGFGPEQE